MSKKKKGGNKGRKRRQIPQKVEIKIRELLNKQKKRKKKQIYFWKNKTND